MDMHSSFDPSPFDSSDRSQLHRPGPLPRYRVMLHYATGMGLLFIVHVLRELTRYGEAEAMSRMWEAYHHGNALILTTHLERAELYQEQFLERGLLTSIEPV